MGDLTCGPLLSSLSSQMKAKTFYEKLSTIRHLNEKGEETFSTHPSRNGEIIARRPNMPDQRILIYSETKTGKMSITNLTTKETRDTFRNANNTCAEEWTFDLESISRPK